MSIGEKIKLLRQQNGLSQESLANKLNVSRQAITKWETNRGMPDIENLKRISELFNVSLDYLVTHDSNELPNQIKERINFAEYDDMKHLYKCIEDCVVLHKFAQATKIYPLAREKLLSRYEKAFEWLVMPFLGVFDIVDKLNNKNKNYLVENNGQCLLVCVSKDTMITTILPDMVINNKFTYNNYKYTKMVVRELVSWKKKNVNL